MASSDPLSHLPAGEPKEDGAAVGKEAIIQASPHKGGEEDEEEEEAFVYPSSVAQHTSREPLPITGLSRTSTSTFHPPPPKSEGGTTDDSGTTPKAWRNAPASSTANPWRSASDADEILFAKKEVQSTSTPSAAASATSPAVDTLTSNPFASLRSRSAQEDELTTWRRPSPGPAPASLSEANRAVQGSNAQSSAVTPTHRPASIEAKASAAVDSVTLGKQIQKAATDGNVSALEQLFFPEPAPSAYPSSFSLANDVQIGTGMSPLMLAAGRGRLAAARFLAERAGGIVDMEDAEGETALHKAAYRGHLSIIKYLLSNSTPSSSRASSLSPSASSSSPRGERAGGLANVEQADHDGWTALHGACSRGYLDIVRYLVEESGATVDARSKGGYTPLMNAASRGHLPIVKYLTTRKHNAPDPFIRNAHGETAYDVAAATFEIHICDVLAAYEAKRWGARQNSSDGQSLSAYNPFALHTTVALVLHENQRLDLRLGTLAAGLAAGGGSTSQAHAGRNHGKIAFKASALSKNDHRAAWSLPPGWEGINPRAEYLAVGKEDVGLPTLEKPFEVVLPPGTSAPTSTATASRARASSSASGRQRTLSNAIGGSSRPPRQSPTEPTPATSAGVQRSHFWLSDWQIDLTPPSVDPSDGWQYSTSFDAPSDQWSADRPPELEQLLDRTTGLLKERVGIKWVRRRRWVRVCRRRLDRPPLGFADVENEDEGAAAAMSGAGDYVQRARYLAGTHGRGLQGVGQGKAREADAVSVASGHTIVAEPTTPGGTARNLGGAVSRADLMRAIAKVARAIEELREGMLRDDDETRRVQAKTLLEALNARLAELQECLEQEDAAEDDEEEEEFHYPEVSVTRDEGPSDYFSRPALVQTTSNSSTGRVPDLTPQLALAPDFRVPTHDQASTKAIHRRIASAPSPRTPTLASQSGGPRWEADSEATSCRRCSKKFTFFVRKHHCRRCGLVVCASCSNHSDRIEPDKVVHEPGGPEPLGLMMPTQLAFRTCDACHEALAGEQEGGVEGLMSPQPSIATMLSEGGVNDAASDVSELSECPVCGTGLGRLGGKAEQEEHVRMCLEDGGGTVQPMGRYLVFMLSQGSPLIGNECTICFESLSIGSKVGRLSCLCFFHAHCISAWLSRGHGCPVHSSRYL